MKLKKALSDLIVSPKRTLLVVFALVLGIWGVGSVLVSYFILTKDLNANYQSTTPLQVVFKSADFAKLDLNKFRSRPEVETAEFRDFTLQRIEVYPDVWIPLWLFGVENFEEFTMARIFPEQGCKSPEKGTILIERDCKKVSNFSIGSSPRVRINSKMGSVRISGICFDPAQAPATQDAFVYAYTDKETFSKMTNMPINQRLIIRLKNVNSTDDVRRVSNEIAKDLKSNGIEISAIEIPKFNEHPHQWQLNTLLFLIGSIGFLAFIMGAVLVSQLMKSIMTSQVRQIGVLKALGASRSQIFQIYIAMLLLLGLSAGIVAVPLSVLSGNAFSYFVAGKLNFNILTTTVPFEVYVYLIIASLLLPILLSVSTLVKASRVSVKEALSDYGIVQTVGSKSFKLCKKMQIPNTFILALRNSARNSRRLAVIILSMALGVAIFSTGFNIRQSLWQLLNGYKNEMQYDVQVALNAPISKTEALAPFKTLENVKNIELWVGGRGEVQSKVVSTDNGAGIVAFERSSKLLKLRIKDGRWLKATSDIEVVLNQQALELYKNPKIGSSLNVRIQGKTIKVKLVGTTEQFEKPKVYIDINQYDSLLNPNHLVNTITFVAKNNSYAEVVELKKNIEKTIAPTNLDVLYVVSQAERVKIIYDHLNIILSTIIILSFLVLVVSAIGMASATGINIWERTREIGVMRAIGATPKKIYSLFVIEGMIVSVISIVLGLIVSYPLSKVATVFFGNLMLGKDAQLQYAFSNLGFVVTIVVTIVFGWISNRIPAKSAVDIPTHKALSYE
ncbi:MAG: FtsX-like permease family protein [Bacteroidota bacterium]